MISRVGNANQYRTITTDVLNLQYRMYELDDTISSGKDVQVPSDAPGFMATILTSLRGNETLDQYSSNLQASDTWMSASESYMDSMLDRLQSALTLAEQMATGTYDSDQHESASVEVENIIAQLISLANSNVEGAYIFAGSDTQDPAVTSELMAADRSSVYRESAAGHGTDASIFQANTANFRLQFTRDTTGSDATISIAVGNTLGDSLGIIDFDAWTRYQTALESPAQAEVWRTNSGAASAASAISNQVGETLSWTADSDAGLQTYRTSAGMTVTGADTVTIGADLYAFVDAADLANQINASGSADYFAHLDGANTVRLVSTGAGAAFGITPGGGGNITVDAETSLTDVQNAVDNGIAANGFFHIDGAGAAFPPAGTDTITIGDYAYTWSEIIGTGTPVTAQDYADALASFVNANFDDVSAEVSTSGADATVQLTANAVGKAGNISLASSNADITTTGAMVGGLDGMDTENQGGIYGIGSADALLLTTSIKATVLEVDGDDITMRLRWYDDDGALQTQDVTLSDDGSGNAVAVTGMGGLSIYRDSGTFTEGAVLELGIGHYQGNEEDIAVNFSENVQMSYNWNAEQILGSSSSLDLSGEQAYNRDNTGTGVISLSGTYRGLTQRELSFGVVDGGQVPGDDVTIRATWTGDDGREHTEDITISGAGLSNRVELPDCDGVYIYLDSGTYAAGDSFYYKTEDQPVSVLDTLYEWKYQLENGTTEEAQTASQEALEKLYESVENLTDLLAEVGTKRNRIVVRESVIVDAELYNSDNIATLQEVDVTDALLELRAINTAYSTALKVTSVISNLYLVEQL